MEITADAEFSFFKCEKIVQQFMQISLSETVNQQL